MNIGNYKKIRKLGDGVTGETWLCEKDGKSFAVKIVDPDLMTADSDFVLTMFSNEVDLAEKLKHPNVVSVIESQINDDSLYSVMECADGGNIEQYCSQDALLPIEKLIEYARQIAKAMDFAYSNFHIVHCDIKPSNILLFGDSVKVSDFGASIRKSQTHKHRADLSAGSPSYMSPEQIQGIDLDAASDIYSFGVVLYQLATGRLPFFATTEADTFHQTLNAEVPKPSLFRVEIHPELEAIIMKCLQKRVASRYARWTDVVLDLARVAQEIAAAQIPWVDRRPIFEAIKAYPFFSDMTEKQVWEILHAAKVISIGREKFVVHRNERSQTLYFVVDGTLAVESNGQVLQFLRAGEVFGEIPYLTGAKNSTRTANVYVENPCTLMMINPQAIDGMSMECRLAVMKAFCRVLATRLQKMIGDL